MSAIKNVTPYEAKKLGLRLEFESH